MFNRFTYFSGTLQKKYSLDSPIISSGVGNDIRDSVWNYSLSTHNITGVTRVAREASFTVTTTDYDLLNELQQAYTVDVENGTPGVLYVDDWQQSAYLVKTQADAIRRGTLIVKITAVLLDGKWHRDTVTSFKTSYTSVDDNEWLNYPHDFPFNFGKQFDYATSLNVETLSKAPISLTVYGQATAPSITIGGNVYSVNVNVPTGGILKVNGLDRTVRLFDATGQESNVFSKASRKPGMDVFGELTTGANTVSWSRGFEFDVTVHEISGAPLWQETQFNA